MALKITITIIFRVLTHLRSGITPKGNFFEFYGDIIICRFETMYNRGGKKRSMNKKEEEKKSLDEEWLFRTLNLNDDNFVQ